MTDTKPPLPETIYGLFFEAPGGDDDEGWQEFVDAPGYTADQMRAYADAAVAQERAEIERLRAALRVALKEADGWHDECRGGPCEGDEIDAARAVLVGHEPQPTPAKLTRDESFGRMPP